MTADRPVSYPLEVFAPTHQAMKDPITGADLLFVATGAQRDLALYFHQRSWLADESMLLFHRLQPEPELMGYLFSTGQVVRITTPRGGLWGATAARHRSSVLALRGADIVDLTFHVTPSAVTCAERVICTLPREIAPCTLLTENCDGTLVGLGVRWSDSGETGVITVDVQTGDVREVCRAPFGSSHVLFSRTHPHLLSFNGKPNRLWLVDVRQGQPWCLHEQAEGELVTHETWWVDDQMLFIGGFRPNELHVKVIDVHTGVVRVIGPGAWVPWRGDGEHILNRWNWWEAVGDEQGRFVVADNWYGDVVVFDAKTTQMHRLTLGHRRYKQEVEEQPTAAWDRSGRRVSFTSQMLSAAKVCVATIPDTWPPDPADEGLILTRC